MPNLDVGVRDLHGADCVFRATLPAQTSFSVGMCAASLLCASLFDVEETAKVTQAFDTPLQSLRLGRLIDGGCAAG